MLRWEIYLDWSVRLMVYRQKGVYCMGGIIGGLRVEFYYLERTSCMLVDRTATLVHYVSLCIYLYFICIQMGLN